MHMHTHTTTTTSLWQCVCVQTAVSDVKASMSCHYSKALSPCCATSCNRPHPTLIMAVMPSNEASRMRPFAFWGVSDDTVLSWGVMKLSSGVGEVEDVIIDNLQRAQLSGWVDEMLRLAAEEDVGCDKHR